MNFDTSTDPWWPTLWYTGALVMMVSAVLLAAGILARRWARATGDVLIAIGALPLTVTIAALEDGGLRVVAAATIASLGMARANAAPVAVLSVMGGTALLAVLAIVGHRHRRRPT